MNTTTQNHREVLHTATELEDVRLTLDEIHAKAEAYFGMKLQREEEGASSYQLIGNSPTNVCLLRLRVYENEGGWRFGGYGDSHRESWEDLCNLHRESVEVEYIRENGQVTRIERRTDDTVTEKRV